MSEGFVFIPTSSFSGDIGISLASVATPCVHKEWLAKQPQKAVSLPSGPLRFSRASEETKQEEAMGGPRGGHGEKALPPPNTAATAALVARYATSPMESLFSWSGFERAWSKWFSTRG